MSDDEAAFIAGLRRFGDRNADYAARGRWLLRCRDAALHGGDGELDVALQDLLHDLRHAAASLGLDFDEIAEAARAAYLDALREEKGEG